MKQVLSGNKHREEKSKTEKETHIISAIVKSPDMLSVEKEQGVIHKYAT